MHRHVANPPLRSLIPRRSPTARQLRTALGRGELEVHYQPKLELDTQRVAGVEALVRWRFPRRGLLTPGEFLPGLEHDPVLGDLADFVLDAALAEAAHWRSDGGDLGVAVNLASASLIDRSLPDRVEAGLGRWGVPPEALVLEITETAVLHDPQRSIGVLQELAAAGVGISLDDFGTGESSLSRLLHFPIVELKIDRTFVRNLSVRSSRGVKVVRAVIALAHDLGDRVVAEGVEDRTTLDRLADLQCDQAQGYYICRPVPAADLPPWVLREPTAADRPFARPLGAPVADDDPLGGAFRSPAVALAWR